MICPFIFLIINIIIVIIIIITVFVDNSCNYLVYYRVFNRAKSLCDYCTFIYVKIAVRDDGNIPSAFTDLTKGVRDKDLSSTSDTRSSLFRNTRRCTVSVFRYRAKTTVGIIIYQEKR